MLVLSRKTGESIVIDDVITIMVVEIRGDKVRLGVEAPREVPVHRWEVYASIKQEGGVDRKAVPKPDVNAELLAACKALVEKHHIHLCRHDWVCPFCGSECVTVLDFKHADNCPVLAGREAIAKAEERS